MEAEEEECGCGGREEEEEDRQRSGEREGDDVVTVGTGPGTEETASAALMAAKGDSAGGQDEGVCCESTRRSAPSGRAAGVDERLTGRGGTAGGTRGLLREGKVMLGEVPPARRGEPRADLGVVAPEHAPPSIGGCGGEGASSRRCAMARIQMVGLVLWRFAGGSLACSTAGGTGKRGGAGLAVRGAGFGGIGGRYEVLFESGGAPVSPRNASAAASGCGTANGSEAGRSVESRSAGGWCMCM